MYKLLELVLMYIYVLPNSHKNSNEIKHCIGILNSPFFSCNAALRPGLDCYSFFICPFGNRGESAVVLLRPFRHTLSNYGSWHVRCKPLCISACVCFRPTHSEPMHRAIVVAVWSWMTATKVIPAVLRTHPHLTPSADKLSLQIEI